MASKNKTVFYCTSCGNETMKWVGQCPSCGDWNTIEEKTISSRTRESASSGNIRRPLSLKEISTNNENRFSTGLQEFDRVLGGGAVLGSITLLGGAPGIGKSTLLLQLCKSVSKSEKILYVSGEESEKQLRIRAERLKVDSPELLLLSETCLDDILENLSEVNPDVLIIDSIQTLYMSSNNSSPGSISQVKDCTMSLMQISKSKDITIFVVGHINKDGAIAGPKVLEHMVDCVLYFEGEHGSSYRILRAAKNRFGSTNEIGVFDMHQEGLIEVPNPSETLLKGRPIHVPGTCVTCAMEGSRAVLAEVQALVAKTSFNVPRRTTEGFDSNRAALLLAVMEKRCGMKLSLYDAYINVIGGLVLDEPASDLSVILSVASSYYDKPVNELTVALGEVGLTGEIRAISNLEYRLKEVSRLGFKQCIIPLNNSDNIPTIKDLEVVKVKNIHEAISFVLP